VIQGPVLLYGCSWGPQGNSRGAGLAPCEAYLAVMPALLPAAATGESATAPLMPRRTLGRTGISVSILAMGCGSRFLAFPAEQATAALENAVGLGINDLDTAMDYGNGESETRVGRVLAVRRREVCVATKIPPGSRTRDAALRDVEAGLKRLRTDHSALSLHRAGLHRPDLAMHAPRC